jgi:hypothetical protein
METMRVSRLDGLGHLGGVPSQCPLRRAVHRLDLRIHPPKPIETHRFAGRLRYVKAQIAQIRIEPLETPPSRVGVRVRIWTSGIRLDVNAENDWNAGIHFDLRLPLISPGQYRRFTRTRRPFLGRRVILGKRIPRRAGVHSPFSGNAHDDPFVQILQ